LWGFDPWADLSLVLAWTENDCRALLILLTSSSVLECRYQLWLLAAP
jgi:hypothetical protein